MNLSHIEVVVQETLDSMPEWVHEGLDNIDVLVVDEPMKILVRKGRACSAFT